MPDPTPSLAEAIAEIKDRVEKMYHGMASLQMDDDRRAIYAAADSLASRRLVEVPERATVDQAFWTHSREYYPTAGDCVQGVAAVDCDEFMEALESLFPILAAAEGDGGHG